jgi:hypothetical protein
VVVWRSGKLIGENYDNLNFYFVFVILYFIPLQRKHDWPRQRPG